MKICILYNIKNNSVKYHNWHDGFTKAISILQKTFEIDMINSYDNRTINFNKYYIVFFKESFNGNIYRKYKSQLVKNNKLGLFISSSNIIPNDNQINMYDILFYETKWYYEYAKLNRHPNTYHAFGVDNEIMKYNKQEKIYDVIFVGNIVNYKRPLKILDLPGKKICLGFQGDKLIVKKLLENDVEIVEFIEYHKLAEYYNKSKLCYVPCSIHGGGERAVLEARSCGIPVKIEDDNPKLKELCESEIHTAEYYAKQVKDGILKSIYQDQKDFHKRIAFWKKYPLRGNINISIQNYNFKMYCDNDDTVVKELYWSNFNNWEKQEINMVIELCNKKKYDYFLDIGSYSGFYTLLLASIFPDINIYSFEIIDKIFERLNRNIKINNFKNITTINKGVSNKNGTLSISKGSFEHGLSSVSYLTNNPKNKNSTNIDVVSINTFLGNKLKNKNVLIKIDTEGTEEQVIQGMKYLMDNNNVDIFIEVNDRNMKKFKNIFKDYDKVEFGRNYFFIKKV